MLAQNNDDDDDDGLQQQWAIVGGETRHKV